MRLTEEQQHIVSTVASNSGVFSVLALAGTGKTTTCLATMNELLRRGKKRILYLVYNRSMQDEARERAKALGLSDIQIYTTHAFAYLYLQRNGYIRNRNIDNLRTVQVKEYLNTNYRTAFWILEVFKRFLYSPYPLNVVKPFVINLFEHSAFIQSVFEELGLSLFEVAYYLLRLTEGIEKGSLPMPHDYYLKYFTFQIAPSLSYDLVILDEAQDANPATVALLQKLRTDRLLMVGDPNQRIYAFRQTIQADKWFNHPTYLYLTTTFRFHEEIARQANIVLSFLNSPVLIHAKKSKTAEKPEAIISRTNAELLPVYLESDPLTTDFERPLEEVLRLPLTVALLYEGKTPEELTPYFKNPYKVLDPIILNFFKDFYDLEDYALTLMYQRNGNNGNSDAFLSSDEADLITAYNLISKEKLTLKDILKLIALHKECKRKRKSQIRLYLTTAHSSKGQEYEKVSLLPGLALSESSLKSFLRNPTEKLRSELNLLYVAITRAGNTLILPEEIENTLTLMQNPSGVLV